MKNKSRDSIQYDGHTLLRSDIVADYRFSVESRQLTLMGRKEVFSGKAKFGVFGDGKEVPQVCLARMFKPGDFRSGYYRDQTLMLALGILSPEDFFSQLYSNTNVREEPASGGRMMNCHFGSRTLDEKGNWKKLTDRVHSSSDISPCSGQIPRLVGLGYASKLYRVLPDLLGYKNFSNGGDEVVFGTIGEGSTSEGPFLESINAMGVLQIPVVLSVWDDGYAISVPVELQTVKQSISEALKGFEKKGKQRGIEIILVKGWDYPALMAGYSRATLLARKHHIPSLVHVVELTQPLGHATSGSHERYKSPQRLEWERENDCNSRMKEWILEEKLATVGELEDIEGECQLRVRKARDRSWDAYLAPIRSLQDTAKARLKEAAEATSNTKVHELLSRLQGTIPPFRSEIIKIVRQARRHLLADSGAPAALLQEWLRDTAGTLTREYQSHLHSESDDSVLKVEGVVAKYSKNPPVVDGREIMVACFDGMLTRDPRVFFIGEDIGKLGDVNQGLTGLQEKHGFWRVTDTGIREASIVGQGIGAALRGLRPVVEIQYLDYVLFGIQVLSDDLSCLHYRTCGGQKAPVIVRTRGHRLEGVWHSGSPLGMLINALRGMHIITPRNMTQAAGFYNTMLASDEPALIIEPLNVYRLKEPMPENLGDMRVAVGVPEILREGDDVTLVTYGSTCPIVLEAATELEHHQISCEVLDVQTLLPFDIRGIIARSLSKTSRIVCIDEDVPGGATAYMLERILVRDKGYELLDFPPLTISAAPNRTPYGTDGDYFCKPNKDIIFSQVLNMMNDSDPAKYPFME